MEAINKPSEQERKRWFSTGYLARGVGKVSTEQHALADAAVIRCGEAKGHRMWIDSQFCADVARIASESGEKGIKARFGHPDMCSDALGTFLGRWKGLAAGPDGVVRGTLHLSSTAAESPKGDLRNYVEQMAAKEPDHFGTSIVFSRDWDAEDAFMSANVKEFDEYDETGKPTGNKVRRFQSPDPANTENLRHARISALHAADLVDDPAATDGMFSGAGGAALAARVSEWLDTHPEVLKAFSDDADMLTIVERYATQLRPFMDRYSKNHPTAAEPATSKPEATPAEPDATLTAKVAELESLLQDGAKDRERIEAELKTAQATVATLTAERDALKAELAKATEALAAKTKALDESEAKVKALLSGVPPVSAVPASESESKQTGNMWADARSNSKKRK